MGFFDNLRNFFKRSDNAPVIQEDDSYKKSILATKIVNLVDKIQRINSFDTSIWNIANTSSHQLERKSLSELERLHSSLENRLSELMIQNQRGRAARSELEAAKWTGQRPQNMSAHNFDRFQRDDGR